MAAAGRFEVVPEEPTDTPQSRSDERGLSMLMLGLKALSQRSLVAISNLFTLATVGSAFWLFMITPEPTVYQLVKLAMYGLFVLAANFIVRR